MTTFKKNFIDLDKELSKSCTELQYLEGMMNTLSLLADNPELASLVSDLETALGNCYSEVDNLRDQIKEILGINID